MIREDHYVERMTAHWRTLGNTPSPELQTIWGQLCAVLNEQATSKDGAWRVLQPATGTGKSQGLALYAAMHSDQSQFAMLVVVRLIDQAEEMSAQINKLAGCAIARCRHTDNVLTAEEMADTQILVVTHKAYEMSLEKFKLGDEERFSTFIAYNHNFSGQRDLVAIDESLNIVRMYQCTLEDLSFSLGVIPQHIRYDAQYAAELDALEGLERDLKAIQKDQAYATRLLSSEAKELAKTWDFSNLRQALRKTPWDDLVIRSEDGRHRKSIGERVDKTLEAAQATLEQWHYYSRKGKDHTLNTASLVIPDNDIGAVILDATASQNLLYRLFQEKAILKPVIRARSYAGVRLHVARCRGVGKTGMTKEASPRTKALMSNLANRIPDSANVFVCSHKALEPLINAYETAFQLQTGHWGAVDGRNDYQHCDTFVGFGLPYRDRTHAANTFFAMKGPQHDPWLQEASERTHLGHEDILRSIGESQVVADIIQAMNRIQIRRVVDEKGHCEPSDCFLVLPTGEQGDRMLESIRQAMPGIRITDWDLDLSDVQRKARARSIPPRSRYADSLCVFMKGQGFGRWSASYVRAVLKIPAERWKALVKQIKSPDSNLGKRMRAMGCRLETLGIGRGGRTYIIKE
ncbi:hypothetical protein [Thioalkalivibrio sp. ALE30]|uniref:hypothetical protein n=1 Tax=Thioalkalivibrio sp. ALE30 TaxID=1158181 RepID=UPI0003A0D52F|nr:hypothetical protein [Thioalkalivibrio sp. ALE30]